MPRGRIFVLRLSRARTIASASRRISICSPRRWRRFARVDGVTPGSAPRSAGRTRAGRRPSGLRRQALDFFFQIQLLELELLDVEIVTRRLPLLFFDDLRQGLMLLAELAQVGTHAH